MKKKLYIFIFLIYFIGTFSFAERITKVTKYEFITVKNIRNSDNDIFWSGSWDSFYDDDYAKGLYQNMQKSNNTKWESLLRYVYWLNPQKSIAYAAVVDLYTYPSGYNYKYRVTVYYDKDGLFEMITSEDYFSFNAARQSFDAQCEYLEKQLNIH